MMDTMNDLPASFGTVERELSETKTNKCSTETLSVKFSENFVLITESYKFCCYPPMYNKLILPKLRITNCEIEKGGLKIWMIYLGYFLLVGGLLMIIAGAAMGNGDGSGPPIGTIILAFGLILFIIGLVLVIIPCSRLRCRQLPTVGNLARAQIAVYSRE